MSSPRQPRRPCGDGNDAAWAAAQPLTVKASGGANFKNGETTATLKAVKSGDMIYFLIQYDDPTQSVKRGPYQKQAAGTWKKLKDPNDKGGDDNVYDEDKWAIIWNINDSIAGFNQNGCAVLCHVGEGKPFGNKYTDKAGEPGGPDYKAFDLVNGKPEFMNKEGGHGGRYPLHQGWRPGSIR